jgi:hypothetical protein
MAAYYVKNKKGRHLGLRRHFDFFRLATMILFLYIIRTATYQKMRTFYSAVVL